MGQAAAETPDGGGRVEQGQDAREWPAVFDTPKPRVVIKADLLPALSALSLVAVLGVPVGWLWSRLAPSQQNTVSSDGELIPVLVESYHRFDGLALYMLLSAGAGVLTAAVLWSVRGRRGPVLLLAAVLGSVIAAWLGTRMGTSFAGNLYPAPQAPRPGDPVETAPRLDTLAAVLVQPLALALVYGLAASWNGLDDLGRRR